MDTSCAGPGDLSLKAAEAALVALLREADNKGFSLTILRREDAWTVTVRRHAPWDTFLIASGATFHEAWSRAFARIPADVGPGDQDAT